MLVLKINFADINTQGIMVTFLIYIAQELLSQKA